MPRQLLPSGPLADVVERMVERALSEADRGSKATREQAYKNVAVPERTLYAWRHGQTSTSLAVADRILSRSPYLWFDVWPECAEHAQPEPSCSTCVGHVRARHAFTGARIPHGFRRTG